jgi:hypothetical protein
MIPDNITVDVHWHEDDAGNVIIDEELMRDEFNTELERVMRNV